MATNIDIQGTPISRLPRESSPAGVDVSGVKSGRTVKVSLDLLATKDDVNNIDNNRKGYFSTDAELKAAYPKSKTGWYAYVGSTGTIWKASGNTWVDTGEPIPSDVDLSLYAKKTEVERLEHETNALFSLVNSPIKSFGNPFTTKFLTQEEVSGFIADLKMEGNLSASAELYVSQINNDDVGGNAYSHYISISINGTRIAALNAGAAIPTDGYIEIPIIDSSFGITKVYAWLNWSVLSKSTIQNQFDANSVILNKSYLFTWNDDTLITRYLKTGKQYTDAIAEAYSYTKLAVKGAVFQDLYPSDLTPLTSTYNYGGLGLRYISPNAIYVNKLSFYMASATNNVNVTVRAFKAPAGTGSAKMSALELIKEEIQTWSNLQELREIKFDDIAIGVNEQIWILCFRPDNGNVSLKYGKHIDDRYRPFLLTASPVTDNSNWGSDTTNVYETAPLKVEYSIDNPEIEEIRMDVSTLQNEMVSVEAKTGTETLEAWQLENDLDFFTGNYSIANLGQYTKKMIVPIFFNAIRVNQFRNTQPIEYRVYKINMNTTGKRDCPIGNPSNTSTHTEIGKGNINTATAYRDVLISFSDIIDLKIGEQVAIYMVSSAAITMKGVSGGLGNPELTSNVSLLSTSTDSDKFNTNWGAGSINDTTNTGWFNVALTLIKQPVFAPMATVSEEIEKIVLEQVPPLVEELTKSNIKLTIPDKISVIVGTEFNLWNDTVSLSVDRGLLSPLNYQVRWSCTKGLITDRCFRFTPTDSDIGTINCTCYLYDTRNALIDSKVFQIIVLPKNVLNSLKRCVYFGDSLGSSAAISLISNFNNSDKYTGVIPAFLGTRGSGINRYEAVGGYGWKDYATAGRYAYRIQVNGITSASIGAKYNLDGYPNPFEIREVNIINGSGDMLIEYQYGSQASGFPATGSLTKVSGAGDDVIAYIGGSQELNNPLWNSDTNSLDIALYRQRLGLASNEKIDAVSFQFGINDASLADDLTTLNKYITDLYNAFISDNPNCKFLIGLTTSSGNTVNGSGANYGASYEWMVYLNRTYRIRQFYLSLQNSTTMPNAVIVPVSLGVDRYYGYNFSERAISQRYTTLEKYHNNYVHPGSSGYGQMADVYFPAYINTLK